MRRRLLWVAAAVAVVAIGVAIYQLFAGGGSSPGAAGGGRPTAVIGSGKHAVGVTASGAILSRRPLPSHVSLPRLPIDRPPKSGRLAGTLLEQAKVLGAAPAVLRSCIEGSSYGQGGEDTGVEVELASGVELRFGTAARAAQKWAAAAAILADPSITEYGYVDLHSPSRASTGGSVATLPPAEPGGPTTCGH